MKKYFLVLMMCVLAGVMTSCGPEENESFDEALMVGKWQEGSLFERYNADGTGATWDTVDDVFEEEAQAFEWTLTGATLLQKHILWNGAITPKTYTVIELNNSALSYEDNYGVSHTFSKVN